jgi:hypothetical protein
METEMKLIISAAAIVALAAASSTGAHADDIIMGGMLNQALVFTPEAGNTLNVSTLSPFGFGNSATYGPDTGFVSFGAMNFTTQPLMAGSPSFFPIAPPATESFEYQAITDPDNPNTSGPNFPDTMTMTISWNQLVNGGEAELDGTGLILTSAGDTPFVTDFPVGGTTTITGFFPTSCNLMNFGSGSCDILSGVEIAFFEGGDTPPGVVPPLQPPPFMPPVPEPMSSFMALGMAVCCLWGTYQLTRRYRDQSPS